MSKIKSILLITILAGLFSCAHVSDKYMTTAIGGYDAVSYFTMNKAVRGSGFHTVTHDGEVYLFSSKENKEMFTKNPSKYAPQYNGWCAFGVSVGKKFHIDPTVFAVVDNKLYLNLDQGIQKKWNDGRAEKIQMADQKWEMIKAVEASKL